MNNFYFWQKKNELNTYQREVRQYQARIVALENELITMREQGLDTRAFECDITRIRRHINHLNNRIHNIQSQGIR